MVNKMSSRKLLVHSLGVVLVFVQILAPLSGLPIIGEHSDDKESFFITESRETVPFTAFTKQMSPSTDRPVVSEPEMSSHKPSKSAAINKKNEHKTPAHLVMDFDHWVDRPAPQAAQGGEAHWSYKDPSAWSTKASTCGGRKQSPIDIQPKSTVLTAYPKFTFHNYGLIEQMSLTNNGHTALYSLPSDYPKENTPFITGGGLSDRYDFIQFHFHWGSDTSKGSEHLIRSKSYPAELHLVHYNTKYGSFAAATNHSDGLAVLAVFIKVDSDDSRSFEPVVKQLNEVMKDGDETILKERVSLNDLLPQRTSSFYRYDGSLTTPGCNEIVTWTIFDNPITVSDIQLSKFRKLSSGHGPLVDNFRPTMPLNGRVVTYRSFTGCEISQSWPMAASPFSEAYKWSKCLMGFAFKTLSS